MELTTLLLLGKRFNPRRTSEGINRVNHMGTLKGKESTTTKVRTSENFLNKIPLVSDAIKRVIMPISAPFLKRLTKWRLMKMKNNLY